MKCNIEYVGKSRQGIPKYYCTVHKNFAHDKAGNKLDECLCDYKDIFQTQWDITDTPITDIKLIYRNILVKQCPEIFINGKIFEGILLHDDSLLTYKDFSGTMLSKLNNIVVEDVRCNHCHKKHSDNGKFAYTPHRIHLCLYCGHLFRAKEKNIGDELNTIFKIPDINLSNNKAIIEDTCSVEYDMLKGKLVVNNENVSKIIFNNKEYKLEEFLNDLLENEF